MTQQSTQAALSIRLRGLSKTYGEVDALREVDLDIQEGEFLTVLGPSGSGKTTLLQLVAGFSLPTAGTLFFGEQEMLATPPHRRNIGMVFQNYALFPHMTVAENVAFPLRVRRVRRDTREAKLAEALEMVKLLGLEDRHIDDLSGGQRQRVALARAIVFAPPILLMDEPLSALDKKLREAMQVELRQLHDRLGTTTIYVTHDQREARVISDRVAILHHGRLVQVGSPGEIYRRPRDSFVADFIGESSLIPVETAEGGHVSYRGQKLKVGERRVDEATRHYLVVRPESVEILTGAEAAHSSDLNRVDARVLSVRDEGDLLTLIAGLEDGNEVKVSRPARRGEALASLNVGEAIVLGLPAADSIVVPERRG